MARHRSIGIFVMLCGVLVTSNGCLARFAAHMLNAGLGNMVAAKFNGLAEKRVAIVTVSGSSSFGPSSAAELVARTVARKLRDNVKHIDLVSPQEIADWMDRNDWNEIDYREVGEAVGADLVLAIDLHSFSLYDGKTLYRGKCDSSIAVYDVKNGGEVLFEQVPPQIIFPVSSGLHTTDASESDFRRWFIEYVGERLARNFYPYDPVADFANDTTVLGG
jgi:hypothetical protein